MIKILKQVCNPNTIKITFLRTFPQNNHEMSFSDPKQQSIIGLISMCKCGAILNEKKRKKTAILK